MQINHNSSLNFQSGLTSKMRQEIASCNVHKISNEFLKNGVSVDFKENKFLAWCLLHILNITKKLNLGFPKGIFLEDFHSLYINDDTAIGICNMAPAFLYKSKNDIIPETTLFFNSNVDWADVDKISDNMFDSGNAATDFFLEPFLHEFAHSMHENNLLHKMGGETIINILQNLLMDSSIQKFQSKYGKLLSSLCAYAVNNPFEAVACDLSKRIIDNLDKNSLTLKNDFLKNSPYRKSKNFKCFLVEDKLSKTIKRFWNGKFY